MHPVIGVEKLASASKQFAIGWMVERRHRRDSPGDIRMSVKQMRVQLLLCSARANDENRSVRGNGGGNRIQKSAIHGHVSTVARVRLVVEVGVRMSAVYQRHLTRIAIEAEDLGDAMVEPDERVSVIVHGHILARQIRQSHTGHCVHGRARP